VTGVGFETPEAIIHDEVADVYLVSNINGSPFEADDNGFISRVAPDGQVVELKWIDGERENVALDAPKGMALTEDTLYVADITRLRAFDRETGKPKFAVSVPGSTFLNGVAVDGEGGVYVSDTGAEPGPSGLSPSGTDAVYYLAGAREVVTVVRDPMLDGPNGLAPADEGVWVATFRDARIYRVTRDGRRHDTMRLPGGQLDGLVRLPDGSLLVSSWAAQAVYHGAPTTAFTAVVKGVEAPASIGYDTVRQRVLVPLFQRNEAEFHLLDASPREAEQASSAAHD
jgi:sugar lactone lactonase YvrE